MNETKGGVPTWGKAILGCGAGCLTLVVLLVVGGVATVLWIKNPGTQIATTAILSPQTKAVLHFQNQEGQLSQVLSKLISEAHRMEDQQQEVPEVWRQWQRLTRSSPGQISAQIDSTVPREFTLTFQEADPGSKLHTTAALNLASFPRLIKLLLSLANRSVASNGKGTYTRLTDGSALAFAEGTILWISSESLVLSVLERLHGPPPTWSPLLERFGEMQQSWQLIALIDNKGDFLSSSGLGARLGIEDSGGIEMLDAGLNITSESALTSRIHLHCLGPDQAARWQEIVTDRLQAFSLRMVQKELKFFHSSRLDGRQVIFDIEISGFLEALIEGLKEAN